MSQSDRGLEPIALSGAQVLGIVDWPVSLQRYQNEASVAW